MLAGHNRKPAPPLKPLKPLPCYYCGKPMRGRGFYGKGWAAHKKCMK